MNPSKYPSDGVAGFSVGGKAHVIGPVKKDEVYFCAPGVEPLFAETAEGMQSLIAAKGLTLAEKKT
jgi:hypothetical protein